MANGGLGTVHTFRKAHSVNSKKSPYVPIVITREELDKA